MNKLEAVRSKLTNAERQLAIKESEEKKLWERLKEEYEIEDVEAANTRLEEIDSEYKRLEDKKEKLTEEVLAKLKEYEE